MVTIKTEETEKYGKLKRKPSKDNPLLMKIRRKRRDIEIEGNEKEISSEEEEESNEEQKEEMTISKSNLN